MDKARTPAQLETDAVWNVIGHMGTDHGLTKEHEREMLLMIHCLQDRLGLGGRPCKAL